MLVEVEILEVINARIRVKLLSNESSCGMNCACNVQQQRIASFVLDAAWLYVDNQLILKQGDIIMLQVNTQALNLAFFVAYIGPLFFSFLFPLIVSIQGGGQGLQCIAMFSGLSFGALIMRCLSRFLMSHFLVRVLPFS